MVRLNYLQTVILILALALLTATAPGCGNDDHPASIERDGKGEFPQLDPANWYPGDAHDHSEYSRLAGYNEGLMPLADVVDAAFGGENPLAWLIMTEHGPQLGMVNGNLAVYNEEYGRARFAEEVGEMLALEQSGRADCLMMGEELGTVTSGHLVAYDINGYVTDGPLDSDEDGFMERVRDAGGFCFIAHPRQETGGITFWHWPDFERDISSITPDSTLRGFELLSGVHESPDQTGLLETWDRVLADGSRALATGTSDAHKPEEVGAYARTYVFLEEGGASLNEEDHAGVLNALRDGHSVVTNGPLALCVAVNTRSGGAAGPGDVLRVDPGDEIIVYTAAAEVGGGCEGVKLISDIGSAGLVKEPGAFFKLTIPEGDGPEGYYLRLEGYGRGGTCYSNPVFLVDRG